MPTPAPSNLGRPDPRRARRVRVILGCGLLAIVAIPLGTGLLSTSGPRWPGCPGQIGTLRGDYVGSRGCSDCHPRREYASHSRSGQRTDLAARRPGPVRPAQLSKPAGRSADPGACPGSQWSYTLGDGRFQAEHHEGGEVERFVIDYAFGSGHHATTFVTMTDRTPDRPTMIEHRLTVFAHEEAPDIPPGQGMARGPQATGIGPSGRRHEPGLTLKCFDCHATISTSDPRVQELDRRVGDDRQRRLRALPRPRPRPHRGGEARGRGGLVDAAIRAGPPRPRSKRFDSAAPAIDCPRWATRP